MPLFTLRRRALSRLALLVCATALLPQNARAQTPLDLKPNGNGTNNAALVKLLPNPALYVNTCAWMQTAWNAPNQPWNKNGAKILWNFTFAGFLKGDLTKTFYQSWQNTRPLIPANGGLPQTGGSNAGNLGGAGFEI